MVETGKGDLSSFYTWRLAGIGGRKGSIVIFFFLSFFFLFSIKNCAGDEME